MRGDRSVLLCVVLSLADWQFDVLLVLTVIVNLKLYIPWFLFFSYHNDARSNTHQTVIVHFKSFYTPQLWY